MNDRYRPEWAHLRSLKSVSLREAVLATLNRNQVFLGDKSHFTPYQTEDYAALEHYKSRIEVAEQRINEMKSYNRDKSAVNLAEFAHWSLWQGWDIAPEMKELADGFRDPGKVEPAEWMRYRVWFLNNATLIVHGIDPNSIWGEYLKWVFNLESVSWIKDPSVMKIHRNYHALVSHFGQECGQTQAVLKAAHKAGFDNLSPFINALPGDESEDLLKESERESLLKMVLGMAVAKYGFDPRRSENDATGKNKEAIWGDLDSLGIAVDPKTIRKHLKEAVRRFPKLKLT